VGDEYQHRIRGKTSEELLSALESAQPGSVSGELMRTATQVRALQEATAASDRLALRVVWLTAVIAIGTGATAVGTLLLAFD
jgi:hypothetical protein